MAGIVIENNYVMPFLSHETPQNITINNNQQIIKKSKSAIKNQKIQAKSSTPHDISEEDASPVKNNESDKYSSVSKASLTASPKKSLGAFAAQPGVK